MSEIEVTLIGLSIGLGIVGTIEALVGKEIGIGTAIAMLLGPPGTIMVLLLAAIVHVGRKANKKVLWRW